MKKIFLILCLFLITGCSAEYNLNINDDVLNEKTIISETNMDKFREYKIGDSFEYYDKVSIPLSINGSSDSSDESLFYSKINSLNDDGIAFGFYGTFKDVPIDESFVVNYGGTINVTSGDEKKITGSIDSTPFDDYSMLEKITVNITSSNKVLKNNADKVKDGVYSWVFTRDNFDSKNIEIVISNLEKAKSNSFTNNSAEMNGFVIMILSTLFVSFAFYVIFKFIYKKKNNL